MSEDTFKRFWKISSEVASESQRKTPFGSLHKAPDWVFPVIQLSRSSGRADGRPSRQFRILKNLKDEYPVQYAFGLSYTSMTIEPPRYLPWLLGQALTIVPHTKTIINCSRLGARYLKDVKDKVIIPDRGQTCVIKTDFKKMITRRRDQYTYLIPRPASGVLILGGINEHWNTSHEPNPASREMFKQRAFKICPELGPPESMEVVKDIVGVRSTRTGGYRLEREEGIGGRDVTGVHSYGYASGGYQASLGTALQVVQLLKGEE
ncbi:hypothetical protein CALVIDRAFT_568358 [Calocera viscosa TUFC12733]|uniref:FAD dependent oxidoreductase domain-containing protein n=1 Tax=Calocera viscosa (strain TUFC12733) TaxID=1330018 RepID=A0A167H7K9_CALVF|nr:hypothetical protein CALVIDRAFT_568358 [Calocera viscosa TUFC12733]